MEIAAITSGSDNTNNLAISFQILFWIDFESNIQHNHWQSFQLLSIYSNVVHDDGRYQCWQSHGGTKRIEDSSGWVGGYFWISCQRRGSRRLLQTVRTINPATRELKVGEQVPIKNRVRKHWPREVQWSEALERTATVTCVTCWQVHFITDNGMQTWCAPHKVKSIWMTQLLKEIVYVILIQLMLCPWWC